MADLALATDEEIGILSDWAEILTAPAGVALSSGDVVTIDASTGKFILADANVADIDGPVFIAIKDAVAGLAVDCVRRGLVSGFDLSAMDYGDRAYLSSTAGDLANLQASVNEVQTLTETGSPTGGTFILTLDGQATAAIAHDATGAQVAAALNLLANVGANGCSGTGASTGPFVITFASHLAGKALPLIVVSDNSMTGGSSPVLTPVETTTGITKLSVGFVIGVHHNAIGTDPDKVLYLDM